MKMEVELEGKKSSNREKMVVGGSYKTYVG